MGVIVYPCHNLSWSIFMLVKGSLDVYAMLIKRLPVGSLQSLNQTRATVVCKLLSTAWYIEMC